jgi:hypothetical protein
MFYIITASSDTYITNKILQNKFRATDSNVGRAGTLDLFKLYDESMYTENGVILTSSVSELSRILIKFDYSDVIPLTSSSLDLNSDTFKAELRLTEVKTGAPVPRNFNVVAYPLAVKFDEGSGKSTSGFSDIDTCNFITASTNSGSPVAWNSEGAGAGGYLGSDGIDYVTSGSINNVELDFGSSMFFDEGPGDLVLDVTNHFSSSISSDMENHGFRISFSGSDESDTKTRFVKRFISRHSRNKLLVPRIVLTWDDSIRDNHLDLQFNVPSSLFLKNFVSGRPANLVSGSSLTELTGEDCLKVRFVSGSGTNNEKTFVVNASQYVASTDGSGMTGVYYGTFNLNQFNTAFFGKTPNYVDEIELKEIWSSNDLTVAYRSGSIKIRKPHASVSGFSNRRLHISVVNAQSSYRQGDKANFRLFIEDLDKTINEKAYKLPRRRKSEVLDVAHYRLVDKETKTVIIPFDKTTNSTKLSTDAEGMYISFFTAGLPKGRTYTLHLLVNDQGIERLFTLDDVSFTVV